MRCHSGRFARRLVATAIACHVAVAASTASAAEGIIDVVIDFAKVLRIGEPAHTVIVGNPGIADATVSDDETLVLTGKTAGTTNLIVLDEEGNEVLNSAVRVSSDIRQLTTVFFGSQRQTFSCSPVCEKVISVGDAESAFDTATKQIQTRRDFSAGQ